MNFINPINIPDNAEVSTIVLGGDDLLIAHSELGPIFDRDANRNIWLNAAICFAFDSKPSVDITCMSVFTKSYVDARNKDDELTPFDLEENELSSIFIIKYQEVFNSLLNISLNTLRDYVSNNYPEEVSLFDNLVDNKTNWLEDDDEDEEDTVELPIEMDIDIVDDTHYSITAQVGPIYSDDGDEGLIFMDTIEFDTLNPTVYTFTKNLLVSDDPDNMDEELEDYEWVEVEDGDEIAEKYDSEYERLEAILLSKLFKTVKDKEALVELAETLEKDGRIERCEDEYGKDCLTIVCDNEDDNEYLCMFEDDDGFKYDDEYAIYDENDFDDDDDFEDYAD
jgi:hypothetical protein